VKPLETQKTVAILIVNWNQKKCLFNCLNSLKNKTAYSKYIVILVDNGSRDGSVEMIKSNFPWVDVVALSRNYGFSIGNNRGIVHAFEKYKPHYVLLLNNDTEIIQTDWLSKMVELAESDKRIGIVGCKLIYQNGETQYIGTEMTLNGLAWLKPSIESRLPEVFNVDAVLGACFLMKSEVVRKIGLLDVGFSPFIHEESDFCIRAKKAGYRTYITLSVSVVHLLGASIGKKHSITVESVVRRNIIRFMLLNFPTSWLLKRIPTEIRILASCFVTKNNREAGLMSIKVATHAELLRNLRINFCGWIDNLLALPDIIGKRMNRNARLTKVG
jgi:GT2 family glycosyltransferase